MVKISPLIWGSAERCQFLSPVAGTEIETSYDGDIALHLGSNPVETDSRLQDLTITVVATGTIGGAGRAFRLNQSFRVLGTGRLEILIEVDDTETFVYFFDNALSAQGVRDATGTFACSLEERQCTLPSGSFSW